MKLRIASYILSKAVAIGYNALYPYFSAQKVLSIWSSYFLFNNILNKVHVLLYDNSPIYIPVHLFQDAQLNPQILLTHYSGIPPPDDDMAGWICTYHTALHTIPYIRSFTTKLTTALKHFGAKLQMIPVLGIQFP